MEVRFGSLSCGDWDHAEVEEVGGLGGPEIGSVRQGGGWQKIRKAYQPTVFVFLGVSTF